MIWKIAIGNLRRHGKRSALIVLAVAISVAVMEVVVGMLHGMQDDFFLTMVSSAGHLTIDAVGSDDTLDPLSLDYLLDGWEQYEDWFRQQPETDRVEPFLSFGALLVNGRKNVGIAGYGIEGDTGFFQDVRSGVVEGHFLEEPGDVLVSDSMRELLDLESGGTVLALVEDATGAPYYLDYRIAGIYRSDSVELDEGAFLIGIDDARDLLYLGDEVREIRVILTDPAAAGPVAERFRGAFIDEDVRIRTWRERNRGLIVLFEMMDVFMYAINLLIVIVAATVITNAILMNVFEKTEEFGMMRAIGLTRRGQFGFVMAEGTVYGVVGSILGLAIGIPVVLYFETHGIDFGAAMESFGLGRTLNFSFRPGAAVTNALFGALVALAGSLYAAIVATRLSILDSLRGSR